MLLGEYAVLHGQHALVCAIDRRMHVKLMPRDDERIILDSSLGHYETTVSHLESVPPFQFVLSTLLSFKKYLKHGCHIQIESEFSDKIGFASSAAVTVATFLAVATWCELFFSTPELIKRARKIVRDVQGVGSGADVAACVLGGIVSYRAEPFIANKMPFTYPMTVVYSGNKTPTPIAIKHVHEKFVDRADMFSELMKAINGCVLQGMDAVKEKDWRKLGAMMNIQQIFMSNLLGVNTAAIDRIIELMQPQSNLLGIKISGAGLGDCVIALGECELDPFLLPPNAKQIRVNMSNEGMRCEKI